jgi:hypothetical protein
MSRRASRPDDGLDATDLWHEYVSRPVTRSFNYRAISIDRESLSLSLPLPVFFLPIATDE